MYNVFTVKSSTDWQLPKKSCLINFSTLQELYCPAPFRSFSIKFVCSGNEKYIVNDNKYIISDGEYLLANHYSEGFVEIDKTVKGICIDVAPDLLSEVVASHRRADTAFADLQLDEFFNSDDFLENKYRSSETHLGNYLLRLDQELSASGNYDREFTSEFYFELAERIVADHIPVYKQLRNVASVKSITKKDLLRRVSYGKEYIDAFFKSPLSVAEVASTCNVSEYHFYRLFKSFFNISPHQYIIKKRLGLGLELLKIGGVPISEIATIAGFSDLQSFSKSFKKHYGYSPSMFNGK
jgi:AraC-like DNA-binding protein